MGWIKTIGEVHKTAINRVFTHVGVNLNRYLNNPLQTSIHKCTDICAYILSGLNIYTHNLSRIYVQPRKTALTTPKDRTRNPERPHSQPRKTALASLPNTLIPNRRSLPYYPPYLFLWPPFIRHSVIFLSNTQ